MKKGNTINNVEIASEETIVVVEESAKSKERPNRWIKVSIGGVIGIVMGGVAYAAKGLSGAAATTEGAPSGDVLFNYNEYGEVEATPAEVEESGEINYTQTQGDSSADLEAEVADNEFAPMADVDDSMSFGEAFAAARDEVGPGGTFVWNNQLFNTYSADEWDDMSAEDKAEFADSIDYPDGLTPFESESSVEYVENEVVESNDEGSDIADVDAEGVELEGNDLMEEALGVVDNMGASDVEQSVEDVADDCSDGDVQILGVEQGVSDNGVEVTYGYGQHNGTEVVVVDVDQDGDFDQLAVDFNSNEELDDGELFDIEDDSMMVADWEAGNSSGVGEMLADSGDSGCGSDDLPDYMS